MYIVHVALESKILIFQIGKHQRLLTCIIITIRTMDMPLSKALREIKNLKNLTNISSKTKSYDGQFHR